MKQIQSLIITSAFFVFAVHAQEKLSLQDALRISLENNYSILIANNNEEAAGYARNIGNAGMLPTIEVNGSALFSSSNIRQEFSNGNTVNQNNAQSTNLGATVQLNWTLFDGLRMFAVYGKLTEFKNQSAISTRLVLEEHVLQLIKAYFDVVRIKQVMVSLKEGISIGEERLKIAEKRLSVGAGAKTEVLQSEIDLNNLKSQLAAQQALIRQSKTTLNQLMNRDGTTEFDVTDSIVAGDIPNLDQLRKTSIQNNGQVLMAQSNEHIQKYARREINALRYPWLNFQTSYNFSRSQNQAGFFLFNQNLGFNAGITVSMNILDSWRINTQNKLAAYALKNAQYQTSWIKQQTDAQVLRTYYSIQSSLQQLQYLGENLKLSEENEKLALQRFSQGISNFIELREAQKSRIDAMTAFVQTQYELKLLETELLRLNGNLIQNGITR